MSARPAGALQAALDDRRYEEAALRLLFGVLRCLEDAAESAPSARAELLALLGTDASASARRRRGAR